MTSHEIRLALFDSPYKNYISKTTGGFRGDFETDDGRWFALNMNTLYQRTDSGETLIFAETSFKDKTNDEGMHLTGEGDQMRILATVVDWIGKALKGLRLRGMRVDAVYFVAYGGSRISLYKRMIKRLMGRTDFQVLRYVRVKGVPLANFYIIKDKDTEGKMDKSGFFN